MEHRPSERSQRLDALLTGVTAVRPTVTPGQIRGALHAQGGYQVLCISGDLAFTSVVARGAEANDAHSAIAWTVEDVERLPFWMFHGVVVDAEAWRDLTSRGSARVRRLLEALPVVVAARTDADQALKSLIADMAATHAAHT